MRFHSPAPRHWCCKLNLQRSKALNQLPKRLTVLFYVVIFALLLCALTGVFDSDDIPEISYSQTRTLFLNEKVESFVCDGNELTLTLTAPVQGVYRVRHELADVEMFREDLGALYEAQFESGILSAYDFLPVSGTPWYLAILPYLLVTVVAVFLLFFLMNRSNGSAARFSRANARVGTGKQKVTFSDVAGADEEKAELQEVVDYLRNPGKYAAIGAKIPKGVLLVGPPGTGKTLLAKAVAGEAGVHFLSISGSDFMELYVGVGASRVRDLFEQARHCAPSIIFIDEIDAIGRRRGSGMGGGHDEREQTLNQLLVEMDGFAGTEGVIVLAATNRHDILDPALLRPGRFDRQVYVNVPDVRGRQDILLVHAKNKPLAEDVDLAAVARATSGFTGADLANLLNEAALLSVRQGLPIISMQAIEDSILKVIAGPEKRSRIRLERDRRITAVHEAGHAVAMHFLPTADPVHQITIIPRGNALGLTISLPAEDSDHMTRNQMLDRIVGLLGGRVAEALEFDDISTGASNDLKRATSIAHDMVAKYGMSEQLGAVSFDNGDEIFVGRDYERTKPYSESTGSEIDQELRRVMDTAYARCREILSAHRTALNAVADFLLEHETMSRADFEAVIQSEA